MIYSEGRDVTPGLQTDIKSLVPGKEYIFDYHAPGIAFAFMSPENMTSLLKGWINLRQKLEQQDASAVVTITGVRIDTDKGDILIRGSVAGPSDVLEAGVNPWAVAAVIGALFAAIGVGVSLLYVYEITGGNFTAGGGGPTIDPCTDTGVVAYVRCLGKETSWLLKGAMLGALAVLAFLLYKKTIA